MKNDFITFLQEDGETCTANVANVRGSLFGGMITRNGTKKRKKKKISESEHDNNFSVNDVVSKIDNVSKQSDNKDNTVPFGLEDENGNITKIYVPQEEADDFKHQLENLIGDETQIDVAEILFKLRNTFTIVDVEWPDNFQEDEETVNKLEGQEQTGEAPQDNIPEEVPDAGAAPPEEPMGTDEVMGEPEVSNQDILMKVLDMLKSQADSEKAKSEAKRAEAEMQKQKFSIQVTNHKIKQEEDLLAAENYYKKQQEEKRDNDRLTKLAKYRSEIVNGTQYESSKPSTILDIFSEDINDDINRIKLQLSDLQVRKSRAVKTFDDQIVRLEKQLLTKQKSFNTQPQPSVNNQQNTQNMQQPMGNTQPSF